jgi:hypothetical protein
MLKPVGFAITLACASLVAGCATLIDEHTPPPEGWPKLAVQTVYLGPIALQKQCWKYQAAYMKFLGGLVMQCVEANFDELTCTQYRPRDATDGDQHEADHCEGYDHIGESKLRDAWLGWVRSKGEVACADRGGLRAADVDWSADEPYRFSCRDDVNVTLTHAQVRARRN